MCMRAINVKRIDQNNNKNKSTMCEEFLMIT